MDKIKYLLVILALLYPQYIFAADLHVGPGQTYSTIQEACNAVNEHPSTIYLHAGTYAENLDIDGAYDGTETEPITITPFESDIVVLQPASPNNPTIRFHGSTDWWKIRGKNQLIIIAASNVSGYAHGIDMTSGTGLRFYDFEIQGNNDSSLRYY